MTISQAHQFSNTTGLSEPLVLIPGFMADARSFMPQIAVLGASRPIILLTTGLADSIERIVADAGPMLPHRFAILGHGLGGNVAIEIVRRHPQAVSRIALIATDPLPEPPSLAAEQEALLVAAKTGHMADCIGQMLPATALHDAPWRDEVLALVQDMAATLGVEQFQRQLRVMQRRPDQQKILRKANVPTLILGRLIPTSSSAPPGRVSGRNDAARLPGGDRRGRPPAATGTARSGDKGPADLPGRQAADAFTGLTQGRSSPSSCPPPCR
jgi:pimeloyl-ACP methyl ester carboxylesterase